MARFCFLPKDLQQIIDSYYQGLIFAYPTEAVFGLGGNPSLSIVFDKINQLKQSDRQGKGYILVANNWQQFDGFVAGISQKDQIIMADLHKQYPSSFVVKAGDLVDQVFCDRLTKRIAVRISNHPIIAQICQQINAPIVATSANLAGCKPLRFAKSVGEVFGDIDIVWGNVGGFDRPSRLIDWHNQIILRN